VPDKQIKPKLSTGRPSSLKSCCQLRIEQVVPLLVVLLAYPSDIQWPIIIVMVGVYILLGPADFTWFTEQTAIPYGVVNRDPSGTLVSVMDLIATTCGAPVQRLPASTGCRLAEFRMLGS
jgi:hypothetical protein